MRFSFDKAACQNTRRALRKEWLLTNGRGDYAAGSILGCNTRKYHGLLVVNTAHGRHVLLSALEESVLGGGKEFFFSTRQHPGQLYPHGHEYQEAFRLDQWPQWTYRVGEVRLDRELFLIRGASRLVLRYSLRGPADLPPLRLRLRPLLACRSMHALTRANPQARFAAVLLPGGFSVQPYASLPPLYFQVQGASAQGQSNADGQGAGAGFTPWPDWYREVEYFQEAERGFPASEDLLTPGFLEISLPDPAAGAQVYLSVGIAPHTDDLAALWTTESRARTLAHRAGGGLAGHLTQAGRQFCTTTPQGASEVVAGYPWFEAWGRDTCISLPGLTFEAGRTDFGLAVLTRLGKSLHHGLLPNMFAADGNHAYNAVDAALWYGFAVQSLCRTAGEAGFAWVRENAWPALLAIIEGYRKGPGQGIYVDAQGLLHAGDAHTQLTWMDAQVNGRPVTPRHGFPVEVNALWYNLLAFADSLARRFHASEPAGDALLRDMRQTFLQRFWTPEGGGHLGDVWRGEGGENAPGCGPGCGSGCGLDASVRPNQIFAVSLPYPILAEDFQAQVVECVRNKLLTPYGLRTLAPDAAAYCGRYAGGPAERDGAYHQGTVWPWLLGHYGDALLRTAWDVEGAVQGLLETLTPLYCDHLTDAGLGSISEVFDGSPPYAPNGCIAQAWSVAECLRLLLRLRAAAPDVVDQWERRAAHRLAHPTSGDTAGVFRVVMNLSAAHGGTDAAPRSAL